MTEQREVGRIGEGSRGTVWRMGTGKEDSWYRGKRGNRAMIRGKQGDGAGKESERERGRETRGVSDQHFG